MSYTTSYDSEAAHLCEIYDDEYNTSYEDFLEERQQGVAHDEHHYKLNKKAKVGTKIVCAGPRCNNRFIKNPINSVSAALVIKTSSGIVEKHIMDIENQYSNEH